MVSNKAAMAAIGLVAFVGAAGAGAYIASRRAPAVVVPVSDLAPSAGPAAGVEATEGVLDEKDIAPAPVKETPPPPVAAPKPAPRPAAARPAPASRRPASQPAPAAVRAERERRAPSAPVRSESPRADGERASGRPAGAGAADRSTEPFPVEDTPVARTERRPEPVPALPPAPQFEEVTVPADAVIGLQLESGVSSDTARIEDRIEARVTRDVRTNGRVAIPAGSRVLGSVSAVERGGKMKERARLGVRFHTVILADGTELPLQTETVYREGDSPANASAAKVGGGAIGGAILGAILGGGKGAAIGAGVGAGAGTAAAMAGGRRPAQIQAGAPLTVKVLSPVTVTVER
jgi:type IV secretory pathway VirB10-like protein